VKFTTKYFQTYSTRGPTTKVLQKMAAFWVVVPCAIAMMMMKTASISDTSVNVYQTAWRNNPEVSHHRLVSSLTPQHLTANDVT
jgi:hypothetical protein